VLLLDDDAAIRTNPHIRSLWPLREAMAAPRESTLSGRPVAALTFALNYAIAPADSRDEFDPGGPDSPPDDRVGFLTNIWGYHVANLLIHLTAALALFGIVRRTLLTDPLRGLYGPVSADLAFIVASLWVLHPLQTESVTYLVQRVESLSGLFYLVTLDCAIRASGTAGQRWWIAGAVVSCALGMATKEGAVTAPILIWLWYWTFRRRALRPPASWLLHGGLAATWSVLLFVAAGARSRSVGSGLEGWSPWSYLVTQADVIVHYLKLALAPTNLVLDYDWQRVTSVWSVGPQAVVLVLLVVLTAVGLVRRHPLGYLGSWVFVVLAPTSSVVPIVTEVAAEHRMYLPLAAVVGFVVLGTYGTLSRWSRHLRDDRRGRAVLSAVLVVLAASLALAVRTRIRNGDYTSEERLWTKAVAARPSDLHARLNYATLLSSNRRYREAESQLRIAVGLDDHDPEVQGRLGTVLFSEDRPAEAIAPLERALVLKPDNPDVAGVLGLVYASQGLDAKAVGMFDRALQDGVDKPVLMDALAWVLATTNDNSVRSGPRAVSLAQQAVRLSGGQNAIPLKTLAAGLAEVGRFGDAISTIDEAIRMASASGNSAQAEEFQHYRAAFLAGTKIRHPG
jgi:cytochrome c-type biogenesis protein CcmH/NrfG